MICFDPLDAMALLIRSAAARKAVRKYWEDKMYLYMTPEQCDLYCLEQRIQAMRADVLARINCGFTQLRWELAIKHGPIKVGIDHAKPGSDRTAAWKYRSEFVSMPSLTVDSGDVGLWAKGDRP